MLAHLGADFALFSRDVGHTNPTQPSLFFDHKGYIMGTSRTLLGGIEVVFSGGDREEFDTLTDALDFARQTDISRIEFEASTGELVVLAMRDGELTYASGV